jgi:hypothetical protein
LSRLCDFFFSSLTRWLFVRAFLRPYGKVFRAERFPACVWNPLRVDARWLVSYLHYMPSPQALFPFLRKSAWKLLIVLW